MIIATGDLKQEYEIIDTIFAVGSHKEGFLSCADPNKVFDGVKNQLERKCRLLHGNAVINCHFEYNVIFENGNRRQVIEIFAYGTAVKIFE